MHVAVPLAAARGGELQARDRACRRQIRSRQAERAAKCEDAVVTGKSPGPCPDAKATTAIGKAGTQLQSRDREALRRPDENCATTGDNDSLASIGWNLGTCPGIEGGSCTNTLTHCGDVATCVQCINGSAADQASDLYYEAHAPSSDTAVKKCQRAIGKESAKFFDAARKALGKCTDAALANGSGHAPTRPRRSSIAKAEAKKVEKICSACGGPDKTCGGPDDLTTGADRLRRELSERRPARQHAGVRRRGRLVERHRRLRRLRDRVQGRLREARPRRQRPVRILRSAPAARTRPTPTPTTTPAPTSTPSNCGNNTVNPGEDCDGSDDAMCPTLCQPDCTCGAPCTLPNPIPVAIALAARPGIDLDTGWTGVSHDLPGVDDAPTTSARLSGCDTNLSSPTCGQCNVSGPIKYQGPDNNCRCVDATTPGREHAHELRSGGAGVWRRPDLPVLLRTAAAALLGRRARLRREPLQRHVRRDPQHRQHGDQRREGRLGSAPDVERVQRHQRDQPVSQVRRGRHRA